MTASSKQQVLPFSRRRSLLASACAWLLPMLALAGPADDVVVIVNKDNTNPVDRVFVQRVYTGALKGWPDGTPVFALDMPDDSPQRERFCTVVLGKSVTHMRALWSQNIFTGKGLPPKVASPDSEMKRIVATNRNAIGYIRASELDTSVKAVVR